MAAMSSTLMRLCNENVYNDNVFHLLGLRTTATPRQIRRKRDDFESAKALGLESWREAFKHLMGNRPIPTSEDVEEAFNHLEDPEYRIVSEFFWMWPLGDDDHALDELADGRRNNALSIWEQEALGFGKKRTIAQHNLAVAYQFYALDAELQALDNGGYMPQEFRTKMLSYWEKSFSYWEEIADNDELWEIFESRMREFDDPRLTGGFIRRFRAEFPVAFDNINAQLAARYAKGSHFGDAKRHVEYMSRTMSGLDDVQENMNIIFTPMEQRVDLLIDGYEEKVKTNPKQGLEYANKLLAETEEIRRVAEGLLKENQRIRTGIFTKIVSACNRYQVQYGNKTEEWEGCRNLLLRLKEIACTPESKKIVEKNIETVDGNIKYDKLQNNCLCCGREGVKSKKTVHLHTRIVFGNEWRNLDVDVCMCRMCQFWHSFRIVSSFIVITVIGLLSGIGLYGACGMDERLVRYRHEDSYYTCLIILIVSCIAAFNAYLHFERDQISKFKSHPRIEAARKEKFHYGAMSQDLAGLIIWIRDHVIGWGIAILALSLLGGLASICGC